MRIKRLSISSRLVLLGAIICTLTQGASGAPASLCSAEELVVFSCELGRKQVSVCASRDLSASSGYLEYRFGTTLGPMELRFPSGKSHPSKVFRYFDRGEGAKGSLSNLQFGVGDYVYTVYRFRHAFEEEYAGVAVKSAAGKFAYLRCRAATIQDGLQGLEHLKLPVVVEPNFVDGYSQ